MSETVQVTDLVYTTPMKCVACGWRNILKYLLDRPKRCIKKGVLVCPKCAKPVKALHGVQTIAGLGMDNEPAWEAAVQEDDRDPFSVPRETVKARSYAVIIRMCRAGELKGAYGVEQNDFEGARDLFDTIWRKNSALFEQLEYAFHLPDADGKAMARTMATGKSDYLTRFGVNVRDPEDVANWYDWVKARHPDRFAKSKAG